MSTIYRNAADLRRAILDAAAHAPADACASGLPDWRPADPEEAAEFLEFPPDSVARTWTDGAWRVHLRPERIREALPRVAMHGPTRPAADKLPRAVFRFTTGPGSVSSVAVVRTAPRLAELAETVRKRWALFGGGAKPEEIKPRQAPRRAEWSPAIFKAWRLQLQDADHVGAMLTGERIGARYYPGGGERGCFALAAPVHVQGMPAGLCSFLRDDGRWIVADEVSGLAVGDSAASRRAAEAGALQRWADASEEKRAAAMERARRDPPDLAAARAAWCKAYGIADPAAPAAPAEDPAPAADLAPAPAAEVAPADLAPPAPAAPAAPAAPLAAAPTPPDSTSREGAPDSTSRETIGAAPAWQILAARPLATYCTAVRRIGVHEWAAVVYVHDVYGACTDYVWRRVDTARAGGPYEGGRFFAGRDWPTYDSNRANYGQPATLAALYEAHRAEIGAALDSIRAGQLPDWAGPQHAEALQSARQAEERRAANLARLAAAAPRPAVVAPAAAPIVCEEESAAQPSAAILAAAANARSATAADEIKLRRAGLMRAAADGWLSVTDAGRAALTAAGYAFEGRSGWTLAAPELPPSAPIADAPIRTDRAETARAAAPAWFDLPRAAVYRAHVATAAIACALYPEPCGPCEDNPRQWLRAEAARLRASAETAPPGIAARWRLAADMLQALAGGGPETGGAPPGRRDAGPPRHGPGRPAAGGVTPRSAPIVQLAAWRAGQDPGGAPTAGRLPRPGRPGAAGRPGGGLPVGAAAPPSAPIVQGPGGGLP